LNECFEGIAYSAEEKDVKYRDWKLLGAGILATISLLLILSVIYVIVSQTPAYQVQSLPEFFLPALLIASVAGLIIALTIVTVVLSALDLGDRNQALGLPEGSVRALIALSLILIFAIMAIYLFKSLEAPYERVIVNNATEWKQLPPSEDQVKFGQQILTTVATLVVAVAGFYFGTRAVQVAQRAAEVASLKVLAPSSPAKLSKTKGKELTIDLQTTPEGEAIQWDKPEGDADGTLVQVKPNQFKYTRGSSAEDRVALKFKLAKYPDVTAKLDVGPPLRVKNPTSPAKLPKTRGLPLEIELEGQPSDEPVRQEIEGDKDGKLEPKTPGKFNNWTYTRGSSAEDRVALKFKLVKDPDVTAELVVEASPRT
jgi:hypothetical protein